MKLRLIIEGFAERELAQDISLEADTPIVPTGPESDIPIGEPTGLDPAADLGASPDLNMPPMDAPLDTGIPPPDLSLDAPSVSDITPEPVLPQEEIPEPPLKYGGWEEVQDATGERFDNEDRIFELTDTNRRGYGLRVRMRRLNVHPNKYLIQIYLKDAKKYESIMMMIPDDKDPIQYTLEKIEGDLKISDESNPPVKAEEDIGMSGEVPEQGQEIVNATEMAPEPPEVSPEELPPPESPEELPSPESVISAGLIRKASSINECDVWKL